MILNKFSYFLCKANPAKYPDINYGQYKRIRISRVTVICLVKSGFTDAPDKLSGYSQWVVRSILECKSLRDDILGQFVSHL